MSLAKQIAARMLGKRKPVGEATRISARSVVLKATRGAPAAETGSKLARASGTQPRHLTPRALSEPDLAEGLSALPLPPPTPELAPPVISRGWAGSCKAIDADSGRQCRMPAHPSDPDRHRHERGPFFRTATPGAAFTRRDQIDEHATRRFTTETQ